MSDFEKIALFEHAKKKLFAGTISANDFKVIVEECSKNPLEVICQKIKEMGEAVLTELELRARRKEEGLRPYPSFSDFDKATEDVLED